MKKFQKTQGKELETKVTKFYFINQGKSYKVLITTPNDVPQYRLKEIFERNFVGKGTCINFDPNIFSQYNGTYTIE